MRMFILLFAACLFAAPFDYGISLTDMGGKRATLRPFKGRKLMILYFSINCPSCRHAVSRVDSLLKGKTCVEAVGVITSGDPEKEVLKSKKPFKFPGPLFYDKAQSFKKAYGFEFVPRTLFIDEKGEVREIIEEFYVWNYDAVFDINVRKFCGEAHAEKGMAGRFYGEAVCRYCHKKEEAAWKRDRHADAYKTLAEKYFKQTGYRKGFEKRIDPECLQCHTTGMGEPGGYGSSDDMRHLQGVQCEQCHSAAGPHDGQGARDYEERCAKCHTSARDPVFNYSTSLKKLNHH